MKKKLCSLAVSLFVTCSGHAYQYDDPASKANLGSTEQLTLQQAHEMRLNKQEGASQSLVNALADKGYVNAMLYQMNHYQYFDGSGQKYDSLGCIRYEKSGARSEVVQQLEDKDLRPYLLAGAFCMNSSGDVRVNQPMLRLVEKKDPLGVAFALGAKIQVPFASSKSDQYALNPFLGNIKRNDLGRLAKRQTVDDAVIRGYLELLSSLNSYYKELGEPEYYDNYTLYWSDMCLGDGLEKTKKNCTSRQNKIVTSIKRVVDVDTMLWQIPYVLYYQGSAEHEDELAMMLARVERTLAIYSAPSATKQIELLKQRMERR